jgi:arylsulfatase A-like enzyme
MKPALTFLTALLLAPLTALRGAEVPTSKPNILFIICDDLNDSVEGFGGHPQARTPNIDRLAHQGVRFLNANCNAPLCAPSRPSMLTGLYPHTTRYFGNPEESIGANGSWKYAWKHEVFAKAETWMQYFRAYGYDVHGAGKIDHNYAERWTDWYVDGKLRYGPKPSWGPFPYNGHELKPEEYTENFDSVAPHPSMPEIYKLSYFVPLSDVPSTPPDPKTGFKGYTGWYLYSHPYRYVSETDRDPMPDELLADYAEKFFASQPASGDSRPFFMNIGINRPHEPFVAPQKYFDMFPLDKIQLAERLDGDLDDCAPFLWKDFIRNRVSSFSGFGKYQHVNRLKLMKRWTQAYLACVAFADDMVGRILDALEKSPYRDNTLVVLVSDNGYHMGQKDYKFKNSAWEESAHIPMVISGPGIPRGKTCYTPVSLIDLYPTFIDFCGLSKEPPPPQKLDGHSLVPLLKNPKDGKWDGPDVALSALAAQNLSNGKPLPDGIGISEAQTYSVRSSDFRYIICPDGSEELYDHRTDPHEWVNLANRPDYAATQKELRAKAEKMVGKKLGDFYQTNSYNPRVPNK